MEWVEMFTFSEYLGGGVLGKCPQRDLPISLGANGNVSATWMESSFCYSRRLSSVSGWAGPPLWLTTVLAPSRPEVPPCEAVFGWGGRVRRETGCCTLALSTPLQMIAECLLGPYSVSHPRIKQITKPAGGKSLSASPRSSFLSLLIEP